MGEFFLFLWFSTGDRSSLSMVLYRQSSESKIEDDSHLYSKERNKIISFSCIYANRMRPKYYKHKWCGRLVPKGKENGQNLCSKFRYLIIKIKNKK